MTTENGGTHHEPFSENSEAVALSGRGPRPHRALADAIPIAKARGLIQMAMGGPERIYDISIVSKIPHIFVGVAFAPDILASISDFAEYYKKDLGRLRLIARHAANMIELWIRSRHGTWRFFQVTASTLVEIDREGNRLTSARDFSYTTGAPGGMQDGGNPGPT